jgi:tight adherence protein C
MEFIPILGALALVGAMGLLWWGLTAQPSAARHNLVTGLAGAAPVESPIVGAMRQLGQFTRRRLPNALIDGLEVNLVQAGHPGGLDLARIIGIKVTLAAMGAAATLMFNGQLLFAVILALVLFFLPDYWVVSVRDQRQAQIQSDAADVIDQLTICVEAGLGFDAAVARVASTTEGPLTDELRRMLSDIRVGVPRAQALRALSDRTHIAEIRQLVSALLQAQKHGVSIADTLRIQAAEIRDKRKQRTEERAAKLAVKMIFPVVVCFLPVFMIVIMVPAVITIFRAL